MDRVEYRESPEFVALYRVLITLQPGEEMTYAELASRVGFSCDSPEERQRVYRVRDKLRRRCKAAIVVIPKIGVRRLPDTEIIAVDADRYRKKARSAARRGNSGLSSVDYDALEPDFQKAHNVKRAQLGAISLFTRPSIAKKIAAAGSSFNVRSLLNVFKQKK
jgi:hypothetical protein